MECLYHTFADHSFVYHQASICKPHLTWSFLCPLICPHISLNFIPVTHLFSRSHLFDSPACIVHFAKLTAEKMAFVYHLVIFAISLSHLCFFPVRLSSSRQAAATATVTYVLIVAVIAVIVTVIVAVAAATFSSLLIVVCAPAFAVAIGVFVATAAARGRRHRRRRFVAAKLPPPPSPPPRCHRVSRRAAAAADAADAAMLPNCRRRCQASRRR